MSGTVTSVVLWPNTGAERDYIIDELPQLLPALLYWSSAPGRRSPEPGPRPVAVASELRSEPVGPNPGQGSASSALPWRFVRGALQIALSHEDREFRSLP